MEPVIVNTISKSTFVFSILGSTVVGFILGWLKEHFQERSRNKKEQEKNLYSQLRFYLKLFKQTKFLREELSDDAKKVRDENASYIQNNKEKGEFIIKSVKDSREFQAKLIKGLWIYIDRVKEFLEKNSKYIKECDFSTVEKFLKAYLLREIVAGKEQYKDTTHIFTDEKINEGTTGIFEAIDELYEKVKI